MLKIIDHRKNKNSKWVTMLYANLQLWIEPCKLPFDNETYPATFGSIESAVKEFYNYLLTTDERYFRSIPDIRKSPDNTSLKLYDSNVNLIFEIIDVQEQEQPMKIYGYARVSTRKQKLSLQTEALEKYGCTEIVQEKISAFADERPLFNNLLNRLNKGDTLTVWKLDRLGRSTLELYKIMAYLDSKGVVFVSLTENIDTKTPTGKVLFGLLSVLAEYETEQKKERAEAGKDIARKNGKLGGRPRGASSKTHDISKKVGKMYLSQNGNEYTFSVKEIAKTFHISEKTVYTCLSIEGIYKRSNLINSFV